MKSVETAGKLIGRMVRKSNSIWNQRKQLVKKAGETAGELLSELKAGYHEGRQETSNQ